MGNYNFKKGFDGEFVERTAADFSHNKKLFGNL